MKRKTTAESPAEVSPKTQALPEADLTQIEHEYNALQAKVAQLEEKYLRVLAEFDNFRKRVSKEQEEHAKFANEAVLKTLLPVLDDVDRVLDHIPLEMSDDTKHLADGVLLVRKNFLNTLEKFSLQVMETEGKLFDPTQHEAIAAIESEAAPGSILAVHRKGYWLGSRLLRPALVTIAKGST